MGDGYAGAAIHKGSVYVIDYDAARQEDAIRRLSLADGAEIWRYTYTSHVKRNHGMSRTVPTVTDRLVVTIGPLCQVVCLDAISGELLWKKDLVEEFGAQVPPWYAGQCPLVDKERVILAPGGNPLLIALEGSTGESLWQTPNPGGWAMTHCSVTAVEWEGVRQFVYSATKGAVGVDAVSGRLLWKTTGWQVPVAAVASPVWLGAGRILFSGGYGVGSALFQLRAGAAGLEAVETLRMKPSVLGATQHTPIFYNGHIYAIIPSGELVCLAPDGSRLWGSGAKARFELGPFLIADGMILALDGAKGALRMIEATPDAFRLVAEAKVLDGHEAWAPMALADGRLIVRDLTRMVCLWVGRGERP
ncbi:MAG TPA: PQQ-like beta-propeller repeat protein [Candidatus Brocadiia bacterium]|nr:PQQ-like beta-propeller repeat protein [Candidatus Brocadiia bacterium]